MAANPQTKFDEALHRPADVNIRDGNVYIKLANGRTLSTPLARHPWLAKATTAQRNKYELGYASVWWPDLDDGLDIEWLLMQPVEENHRPAAQVLDRESYGASHQYHVVPHSGKWAVKGAGNERVTTIHDTQKQAINAAREIAKNHGSDLVIQRPNGQIRNKESYGNPKPPRSKS